MGKRTALIAMLALFGTGTVQAGDIRWKSLGPDGGWISALAIDPENPGTIYAGTRHNGVFKSTDGGDSWIQAGAALQGTWVWAIAIDPQDTNTLYASVYAAPSPSGVFKTMDGGATWAFAGSNLPEFAGLLIVDPQRPGTLYASPGAATFFWGDYFGVYKTIDGGANWTALNLGVPDDLLWIFALAIDPRNPDTLYASGLVYTAINSIGATQLFKSTDGGATWTAQLSAPAMTFLIVDPQDSNRLFAASGSDIWKSTDAGATWLAAARLGIVTGFNRPLALAVDPQNTDTLYIVMLNQYASYPSGRPGGQPGSVFRSADAGEHWTEIGSGLAGASFDPMDGCSCNSTNVGLVVDPFKSNTVYVGANGDGVFKTVDGGVTWKASNSGLKAIGAGRVTIDARHRGTIYALASNRIYTSL